MSRARLSRLHWRFPPLLHKDDICVHMLNILCACMLAIICVYMLIVIYMHTYVHAEYYKAHMLQIAQGRRSMVGYDRVPASKQPPLRTLPCAVSLALRRRPSVAAMPFGCSFNKQPGDPQILIWAYAAYPVSLFLPRLDLGGCGGTATCLIVCARACNIYDCVIEDVTGYADRGLLGQDG
jgi:hypothetical protein